MTSHPHISMSSPQPPESQRNARDYTSPPSTALTAVFGSGSPASAPMPATSTEATQSSQSDTGQESTPAGLARQRKLVALRNQSANLEKELEGVLSKQALVDAQLKKPENPEATVKRHIELLHRFNEIRDVAQGLIGLIAERRGVRVQELYPEFGLDRVD